MPVFIGHGGHGPAWQVIAQLCCPQSSGRPQGRSHCHVRVAQLTRLVAREHTHARSFSRAQGLQAPVWHVRSQRWMPQSSRRLQRLPQANSLSPQRRMRLVLPQWHLTFTICGHGGHGPAWHKSTQLCPQAG